MKHISLQCIIKVGENYSSIKVGENSGMWNQVLAKRIGIQDGHISKALI